MSAVDRFHASWPRGVSPSVVEHFAGAADHVAPAMTLWSGAERVAGLLASAGIEPGDRVGCAVPPGIRWVQTFIACLMRGATFCPVGASGRPATGLRGLVDEKGAFTLGLGEAVRAPGRAVCFPDGRSWSADDLDGLLGAFGEVPLPRNGARLCSEVPWWEPAGFACATWLGLSVGAELHLGLTDDEVHRLGPDVLVCRPGRLAVLLEAVPPSSRGLVVVPGAAEAGDLLLAAKHQWQLLAVPLPR